MHSGRADDVKAGLRQAASGADEPHDRYLRMLLTHGARSVLRAATVADRQGRAVDDLRRWALGIQGRAHHNRATGALANKLARICYAVLRDHANYAGVQVQRELQPTYPLAVVA